MKALVTLSVHALCTEEELLALKSSGSLPQQEDVILTKVVDEELIDDNIDAVKLVTDRYKNVGI